MTKRCLAGLIALVCTPGLCGCADLGSLWVRQMEEVVVEESPRWIERNRVALVDVDGFIGTGRSWLLGGTTVADVKEKLDRAARDRRVKAVVLRINSPGGEVSASDMIHREVLQFREESRKPVVAALMGTAASGGYYVAVAADCIVASPTTITGSVGAVAYLFDAEGLLEKVGMRSETIKSGAKKDIGAPTRAMTPEEREILQGVTDTMFDGFLKAVRAGRPDMSESDIAAVSDGRILTAGQALELHAVDAIGYLDDAIAEAMDLAEIETADIILYRAFPHYNANIYAKAATNADLVGAAVKALLRHGGSAFLYLWTPGA